MPESTYPCADCLHYPVCFLRMGLIDLGTRIQREFIAKYGPFPESSEPWTCKLTDCPFCLTEKKN